MSRAHGFLLRFIDLGLLLLMAFLAVAELDPTHHEPLPGSTTAVAQTIKGYAVTFNESMRLRLTSVASGQVLCEARGLERLQSCMQLHQSARIVLVPEEQASVQQLVMLLDYCKTHSLDCTIAEDG